MITYVIGFIGSSRMKAAMKLATIMGEDTKIYDTDQMIEEKENTTIKKLVMTMGEHEYRNKENAALKQILEEAGDENVVVVCGDSIIVDDENADIIRSGQVCFVNDPALSMWKRAREEGITHHAFMYDEDEAASQNKFLELYQRRLPVYEEISASARKNRKNGEPVKTWRGKILG